VQEGYIIERRDFYLPYLDLVQKTSGRAKYSDRHRPDHMEIAEADAPLALEALRRVAAVPGFPLAREARSAFRKLAFDIDPHAFMTNSPVLFMDPPGTPELTERLRTLSDALLARKRLTFRYHGMYRGEETSRSVSAYGLLFQHGHWYLIGHDETRADTRVFRVGRMSDVVANNKSPNTQDYAIPDQFRLDAYVGLEAWELGDRDEEPIVAHVRFRFPLSLWADRNDYGELEARASDGAAVRRFVVQQAEPFLRWLLGLGPEAEIIGPASLQEELLRMARSVASAHEGRCV
jgi:predicted DNA-binding transcriptional regulator YafY